MIKKKNLIYRLILLTILILAIFRFIGYKKILAQETTEGECDTREECEALLKKYEEEIANYEKDIAKTQKEKDTLSNKVATLKNQIKKIELQISQSNLMIKDLGLQIQDTEKSIDSTSLKIEDSKEKLSNILRMIYEEDQKPLFEILLSDPKLSDFFDNLMALETLNSKNQELLKEIKNLKSYLEGQKDSLDQEKEDLEKVAKIQLLQKQENEATKKNQEYFLKLTEAQYQQYLKEKNEVEKIAAGIRAKLFQLIGVAKAPTFGEALELAKSVASIVNIRPAFLLAIISQESAIGRNVGQCVLTDPVTGMGKKISSGAVVSRLMKPTRDVQPFLKITSELGRDPYNTPVSCPLITGWGGAMGPAQFIPSTWNLYADRLKDILGKAGDPWDIKDSFTASALYLSDLGAEAKTTQKERSAANRYCGGYSWYAGQVMERAACIQNFIDLGTMSSDCESLIF